MNGKYCLASTKVSNSLLDSCMQCGFVLSLQSVQKALTAMLQMLSKFDTTGVKLLEFLTWDKLLKRDPLNKAPEASWCLIWAV